jgi:putative tricarboxylic transport membrane protein
MSFRQPYLRPVVFKVLGGSMLSILNMTAWSAQGAEWKPERNVEIIVPAGAGGGQDRTARILQQILQSMQMAPSASVVNRPGGAGTIAWTTLNRNPGDGHYLSLAAPALLTNHIIGNSTLHYTDVTPIAVMGSEYVAIAVRADSPLRTLKELMAQLKKDPASVSISVGSRRADTNHIAISSIGKAAGADIRKLKTIVLKSGSEAMTSLLGGHIDLIAAAHNNVVPHAQSGKLRLLAISSPQRLRGALADVPTLNEQGVDAVVVNWRTVIGPTGMTQAQIAYWDGAFSRVTRTDEWKRDLENTLMENTYMTSAQTRKYLGMQYENFKGILTELGLAK